MKRLLSLGMVGCLAVIAIVVYFMLSTSQTLAAPTPDEVAQQGLTSWLDSVRSSPDIKAFGFKDMSELSQVSLGKPYPVLMLTNQNVQDYRSGQKVQELARPLDQLEYPLTVNGEARGFLTVEQFNGQWRVVALGGFPLSEKLLLYSQQNVSGSSEVYLVKVPIINGTFAVSEENGMEQMSLLASYPGLMPELDRNGVAEYDTDIAIAAVRQAATQVVESQQAPQGR
jgi:hypothetical protein